ncbi:MAG: cation transporter, partial [Pyrinomonadaceae bacterium]
SGYIAAAVTASPQPATEFSAVAVAWEIAANKTAVIEVRGMTCAGCEANLEIPLGKLRGVVSVDADYKKHNVTVVYDPAQVTVKQIKEAITATGYEVI